MRYPQPNDRYDSNVLCSNFKEIDKRFGLQTEEIERVRRSSVINSGAIMGAAEGENISVSDSTEAPPFSIALYGKARQNTTSGKNLLPYPACQGPTYKRHGVNFVQNEDGSVTVSGTHESSTNKAYFGITPWWANNDNFKRIPVFANKTYKITCKGLPSNWQFITELKDTEKGSFNHIESKSLQGGVENLEVEYTPKQDGFIGCGLMQGTGIANEVITPFTCYPMIRYAEITDDTWEQPTNGATPRPDYPQEIEVSGESYNLLHYPYYENSKTTKGIDFTVLENGIITANGTNNTTSNSEIIICYRNTFKKGSYILSGCPSGGSDSKYRIRVGKGNSNEYIGSEYGNGISITLEEDTVLTMIILIASGVTADNLTFYPMLRKASVKNDRYMPYGVGSVEVKSCGKNLFDLVKTPTEVNGITFTPNDDGTFNASGTATANVGIQLYDNFEEISETLAKGGDFTLSLKNGTYDIDTCNISISCFKQNSTEKIAFLANGKTVSVPNGATFKHSILWVSSGVTIDLKNVGIQLEKGSATEFQPYKGTTATIPTNGLAGIPVLSGGNYTDSNGQQWICDEIVKYADGSGEKIQRIQEDTYTLVSAYGSDNSVSFVRIGNKPLLSERTNLLCNIMKSGTGDNTCRFDNKGNNFLIYSSAYSSAEDWQTFVDNKPIVVKYILAEPITTPLTAEQIAEIDKMSMFNPVTNISNDADAHMKIEYIADTNIYVNNLKAAHDADIRKLTAAIEALGGTVE